MIIFGAKAVANDGMFQWKMFSFRFHSFLIRLVKKELQKFEKMLNFVILIIDLNKFKKV